MRPPFRHPFPVPVPSCSALRLLPPYPDGALPLSLLSVRSSVKAQCRSPSRAFPGPPPTSPSQNGPSCLHRCPAWWLLVISLTTGHTYVWMTGPASVSPHHISLPGSPTSYSGNSQNATPAFKKFTVAGDDVETHGQTQGGVRDDRGCPARQALCTRAARGPHRLPRGPRFEVQRGPLVRIGGWRRGHRKSMGTNTEG